MFSMATLASRIALTVSRLRNRNQTVCTRYPSVSVIKLGRAYARRPPQLDWWHRHRPKCEPRTASRAQQPTKPTPQRTQSTMDSWTKLQSSFSNLNLGQSANKFAKGFNSSVQATRERLGQVAPGEITELPQGTAPARNPEVELNPLTEYKDLEARVDALRQAHLALFR